MTLKYNLFIQYLFVKEPDLKQIHYFGKGGQNSKIDILPST